jgi:hypothetical protein
VVGALIGPGNCGAWARPGSTHPGSSKIATARLPAARIRHAARKPFFRKFMASIQAIFGRKR